MLLILPIMLNTVTFERKGGTKKIMKGEKLHCILFGYTHAVEREGQRREKFRKEKLAKHLNSGLLNGEPTSYQP